MKKLIAMLLVLIMVTAVFAGCGEKDSGEMYIPVLAKGFQHQFWQTVEKGSKAAAEDLCVKIYFVGPESESDIDVQVDQFKQELGKNPDAIALAALSTEAVKELLQQCADNNIPVIGFDSGVPGDASGALKATASTNNQAAAAIAAEKFGAHEGLVAAMKAATKENPVRIACLSQDATSESVTGRTTGFVNKMYEEASKHGTVAVVGHDTWKKGNEADASIIIEVGIAATPDVVDVQNTANMLLAKEDLIAVFCSNEGAVTGFLAAVSGGTDLADGGKYADLVVAGFDAGKAQKDAVRAGYFYGSVTQDPYRIGYLAVELAFKAAKGETVENADTGAKWYDASNIDADDIKDLVYD